MQEPASKPSTASKAGVGASRIQLTAGPWPLLLDFLDHRFPAVGREHWQSRMQRGKVSDASGKLLAADAPFVAGTLVQYYRELAQETPIPFAAQILHRDAELLVADKPHFLPTMPAGRFVQECLLARLQVETGIADLVPLHRLDRATAGLVMFSVNPQTRDRYSALFADRRITKTYEALAVPAQPHRVFPIVRRSRIASGDPFFRMREVDGEANAETRIELMEIESGIGRYRLRPASGKKHQLRVHMAALGMAILNDRWYPDLLVETDDDYARPLKLLARSLSFDDPVTQHSRVFESQLDL